MVQHTEAQRGQDAAAGEAGDGVQLALRGIDGCSLAGKVPPKPQGGVIALPVCTATGGCAAIAGHISICMTAQAGWWQLAKLARPPWAGMLKTVTLRACG